MLGLIRSLGYIGLDSPQPEAWIGFAQDMLGMQARGPSSDGTVALRMDGKAQRFMIRKADSAGLGWLGFELDDATALDAMCARLESAGFAVNAGSAAERAGRSVDRLIYAQDPEGHRVEFYCGLAAATDVFQPGRPIGGFRTEHTASLGFGHAVLLTRQFAAQSRFYREVLGCGLSDFHGEPFPAEFLHVNARHHTIGLIGTQGAPGIHHIMCEYHHLDDLGRAYDLALARPDAIGVSLGRHLNDHVTSFYVRTPDRSLIELGWAGRLIDPDTWVAEELASPSLWGHVRHWLPPEGRARAEQMTRAMGAAGVRMPVHVMRSGAFDLPD